MHTNKSFILSVLETVKISSTIVLGWHQDILTIVQTLGILTFCYILCLVISDPRYVCVYVPSLECWNICQEIMQRTLDHERALACAYQSNLNPAPGPDTLHGKVTVLYIVLRIFCARF